MVRHLNVKMMRIKDLRECIRFFFKITLLVIQDRSRSKTELVHPRVTPVRLWFNYTWKDEIFTFPFLGEVLMGKIHFRIFITIHHFNDSCIFITDLSGSFPICILVQKARTFFAQKNSQSKSGKKFSIDPPSPAWNFSSRPWLQFPDPLAGEIKFLSVVQAFYRIIIR